MIRVIKPGKVRAVTCPYCDCVFSFAKEDVKYGDQRDYYEEIDCPCCKETIELLNLDKENEISGEEGKPEACYKCAYYNRDRQYWCDNSIVVTHGSCMKCRRNFVSIDPYNQVPSWCPLKGE